MPGKRIYKFNPRILGGRYWSKGVSERSLAREYGVDQKVIHNRLVEYRIRRKPRWHGNFKRNRDGWAKYYTECIECGSDEKPHKALGLCESCYRRARRISKRVNPPQNNFRERRICSDYVRDSLP